MTGKKMDGAEQQLMHEKASLHRLPVRPDKQAVCCNRALKKTVKGWGL
jgi:hypothetical protein